MRTSISSFEVFVWKPQNTRQRLGSPFYKIVKEIQREKWVQMDCLRKKVGNRNLLSWIQIRNSCIEFSSTQNPSPPENFHVILGFQNEINHITLWIESPLIKFNSHIQEDSHWPLGYFDLLLMYSMFSIITRNSINPLCSNSEITKVMGIK